MSPLCQAISVDGATFQIEIYRGGSSGWTLGVVDSLGTSSVWDDPFATDQLAFGELTRTIREEGVRSILEAPESRVP